jgi:hypothetical protein
MSCWTRSYQCASCSVPLSVPAQGFVATSPYVNLYIVPFVHTERFDLGDVCPQLSVERRAAHAEEDAQLGWESVVVLCARYWSGPTAAILKLAGTITYTPTCPTYVAQ